MSNQLLKELRLLAAFKKCSITSNRASEKIFLLAFDHPKPLFSSDVQIEAKSLIEKSLPIISESFNRLKIRLEPDLVEFAQRCCSGFQYIVDELNFDASEVLEGTVSGVTEYIQNCKELEIEPEYPSVSQPVVTQEQIAKIPKNHWWWFVQPSTNESE